MIFRDSHDFSRVADPARRNSFAYLHVESLRRSGIPEVWFGR